MKIIANRSTLNLVTLTYGQLKSLLPSTRGIKLPTEKALRSKEPLFIVTDDGAQVNVYEDGFLAYLKRDDTGKLRATVYAVDRCDHITYEHGSTKEEFEDVDPETKLWTFGTCKVSYKTVKGQLVRVHTVPESEYIPLPASWSMMTNSRTPSMPVIPLVGCC